MTGGSRPAGLLGGARLGLVLMGLLTAASALAAPLAAQLPGRGGLGGPPTDTLTTEQRLNERLRLLNRGPGADSATIAADSARLAGGARAPVVPVMAGADSIMRQLVGLAGYEATQYQGRSASWDANTGRLYLLGDSARRAEALAPGGDRLMADSIDYSQESGEAVLVGQPVAVPANSNEMTALIMRFNVNSEEGVALDARTKVTEGAEWNVRGDLNRITAEETWGSHLMFTSCEEEEPHYHFQAAQYKWTRGGTMVAKNVKLYFADVPVMWLPFIAQNTQGGRSSGLLAPRFSVNDIVRTIGGYRRRLSNLGYYWAMSDYSDATIAMDWFDDNYTSLTVSGRYRWLRQFMEGSLDLRQYWRAEGGTETAVNTNHSWQISERTSFRASARYITESSFITQNSFNPQEVTQSINSQGGVSHRFDWGNLSVSGDRRQFLSDDRTEMTLPSATLSLSTITLFEAPLARASWYNNMTWSGSANFSRRTLDRAQDPLAYIRGQEDQATTRAGLSSSINLGNLSLSASAAIQEDAARDVPLDSLSFFPGQVLDQGIGAFMGRSGALEYDRLSLLAGEQVDVTVSTLNWSTTLDYQQTLIGSTTITPRVSFSGNQLKSDTLEIAQSFVAAPSRVAFGATLKSDIYGFFPGFGGFERIRHKLTPSFTYDWSPEVQPTPLQEDLFGSRSRLPQNVLAVGLNQTFEAKRAARSDAPPIPGAAGADGEPAAGGAPAADEGPRRIQQGEIVNLLSLRTGVVSYNFVDDSIPGSFLDGFETTRLTNQISSDFLRGLSISMAHDLFDERPDASGTGTERFFDPHLAQVNLGFQLSSRSSIFRWLGLTGGSDQDEDEMFAEDEQSEFDESDPFALAGTDETSMVPGTVNSATRTRSSSNGVGEWSTNFSYSMTRPREGDSGLSSKMLQASLRLQPTEMWEMSWNTSYDVERKAFNDHTIRLTRDLHRWRANFDFLQTATGNWTFRFEVSLIDNRDLKFDYEQRNLDRRGR